jgi:hypothetical protein
MDYSIFSFKAVVDFIEIEIQTATRALAGKIETKLRLSGVTAIDLDPDAGNYASIFKIKLHDLGNFADLNAAVARIASAYPFARPPTVTMIEVAFDGRLKKGTNNGTGDDLAMLAARMVRFVTNPAGGNKPRLYHRHKGSADFDMPVTVEALARKMSDGFNVGIGNVQSKWTKQDDESQHCYFKTTDHRKQLPTRQHRARFENRLADAGLPHHDIEGWQGFKFESLAAHFNWRKENDSGTATPLQQLIMDRPGASHRKDCKRHKGTVGGKGGGTRAYIIPADKPLNDIARKCLENLTRAWKKGEKTPHNLGPIVADFHTLP